MIELDRVLPDEYAMLVQARVYEEGGDEEDFRSLDEWQSFRVVNDYDHPLHISNTKRTETEKFLVIYTPHSNDTPITIIEIIGYSNIRVGQGRANYLKTQAERICAR